MFKYFILSNCYAVYSTLYFFRKFEWVVEFFNKYYLTSRKILKTYEFQIS